MFTKPKNGWTEIHLEDFEGTGQLYAGHPCFCVKKGCPVRTGVDTSGAMV